MPRPKIENDQRSEAETIKRRDEAIKRALNTPPKPYKDARVGQTKPVRKPPTAKK